MKIYTLDIIVVTKCIVLLYPMTVEDYVRHSGHLITTVVTSYLSGHFMDVSCPHISWVLPFREWSFLFLHVSLVRRCPIDQRKGERNLFLYNTRVKTLDHNRSTREPLPSSVSYKPLPSSVSFCYKLPQLKTLSLVPSCSYFSSIFSLVRLVTVSSKEHY